jgi:hypothetical protein
MKSKKLIKTITKWLKEEIAYGQPVVDGPRGYLQRSNNGKGR